MDKQINGASMLTMPNEITCQWWMTKKLIYITKLQWANATSLKETDYKLDDTLMAWNQYCCLCL